MQFSNSSKQVAVVPADATALPRGPCESLWIGVGGTLTYIPADPALAGGLAAPISTTVGVGQFPCKVWGVNATGTTASQILALY